jgi:outer membrane immunogenic protein
MRHITAVILAIAFCVSIQSASANGYNWTGFYAGIHAGGVWGKNNATDLNGWNGLGDSFAATTSGFNGGGQIGYNWQLPSVPLVLGLEGDIGYLGFKGSALSALATTLGNGTTTSSSGGIYGTLRGRLGVAWDSMMIYGTGGLMFANVRAQIFDPVSATQIQTSSTATQSGWTIGGGLEYALSGNMSGWTMKGEYLHFDLGTTTVGGTNALGTFNWDIKNTGNIVRFGLNRRF